MNRMATWFAGCLVSIAPLAFAQNAPLSHQSPEDSITAQQLVAWSRLQKPQPAPQPLPPRDTPIPQPDPQDEPKSPSAPDTQETANQSFTGKILEDGGKYVLKVAGNTTYQMDAQGEVKQYVGQNVKVIGKLDKASNTIRVAKIELLS
jgi:hypothetical protein